jgi:hypothetical protein
VGRPGGLQRRPHPRLRAAVGQAPGRFQLFIEWKANDPTFHWLGFRLEDARTEGSRAMLSVETSGTGISNAELANGAGDAFLVRLNGLMAEHGEVVYLRPLSEMNKYRLFFPQPLRT